MTTVYAWKRELIRQTIAKHPLANDERIAALTGSSANTVRSERKAIRDRQPKRPTDA